MNSDDIVKKIKGGFYKLAQKRKGRSEIWNVFADIRKDDGTILEGYLCCRKCIRLYKFHGKATSNLNRHRCYSIFKAASAKDGNLAGNENSPADEGRDENVTTTLDTHGALKYRESHTPLDIENILQNIHRGIYKLSQKRNIRSKIWNIFAMIRKEDGSILQDYVCCRKCIRIYKYSRYSNTLNRHKCYLSISKADSFEDINYASNENSRTGGASDEDVKVRYSDATVAAHSESEDDELSFPGNGNGNRAHGYAKQVDNLCDDLKIDSEYLIEERCTTAPNAIQQNEESECSDSETNVQMDSDCILKNIELGVYKLSQKRNTKSKIWDIFAEIKKEDESILQGYLCCRKCTHLYKFDGRRTSNLNRHKCYTEISKGNNIGNSIFTWGENTSTDSYNENVSTCDPLTTSNERDELEFCESPPRKQLFRCVDSSSNVAFPKYTITPNKANRFAKQLDSLCDLIKSDLQDLPEELFYNAKWKIMDVLRDVHRAKLENKSQRSVFCIDKRKNESGIRVNSIQSVGVSSRAAAPKRLNNVLKFFAKDISDKIPDN